MRHGALCSGYGGLTLAVEALLGCDTVWHADIEPAAVTIHEMHWPDVPNLGDLTTAEWPPVEVISAGFPCQPVSGAGKRKGTDDERWLWNDIAEGVGRMEPRPRYLFLENVRGLLSANGGDAFRSVAHDLAALGFDAEWVCIRASDVGAPHERLRWFCVAENIDRAAGDQWRVAASDEAEGGGARADAGRRGGAPVADPGGERHGGGQDGRGVGRVDREDAGAPRQRQRARQVAGHRGAAAAAHTERSGRTRRAPEPQRGPERRVAAGRGSEIDWGTYAPAIDRWARVTGRPAPSPVGASGTLAPLFVEWMMGLPEGWVTGAPINRNAQLKALGNGVVPLQAHTAYSHLLHRLEVAA